MWPNEFGSQHVLVNRAVRTELLAPRNGRGLGECAVPAVGGMEHFRPMGMMLDSLALEFAAGNQHLRPLLVSLLSCIRGHREVTNGDAMLPPGGSHEFPRLLHSVIFPLCKRLHRECGTVRPVSPNFLRRTARAWHVRSSRLNKG